MSRAWSDAEIRAQRERVSAAPADILWYEKGRLDAMLGNAFPLNYSSTIQKMQWEAGFRDELHSVPRPY